eukprot:gene13157-15536_t
MTLTEGGAPDEDTDFDAVFKGKFEEMLGVSGGRQVATSEFYNIRDTMLSNIVKWGERYLEAHHAERADDRYGFYRWIPQYIASVVPDQGSPVSWKNKCFPNNTLVATTQTDGTVLLSLSVKGKPLFSLCTDTYLLATVDGMILKTFGLSGDKKFEWKAPASDAKSVVWDLKTKGIRVFRMLNDRVQTVKDILTTAKLFVGELTKGVPKSAGKVNMQFLADYTPFKMQTRTAGDVPVDSSEIQSGDFFGIVRLDGLDPMLAWAMGSTTGHTTVALWDRSASGDQLFVCESTAKDSYWPAKEAGFNVVWLPLSKEYASKFNETAAWEWYKTVDGLDYGYSVMFWSWIDTLKDNYPCTAPDFADTDNSVCLSWELLELLPPLVDKMLPTIGFGTLFFQEAWNHRLDLPWNTSIIDAYYAAGQKGIDMRTVPVIIEKDDWRYHTTRNNKPVIAQSMVCCVFVCNLWKHAGIFSEIDDSINCGELTNLDDYALAIFDSELPSKCTIANPGNPSCQIMGDYTLRLNKVNSKKMYPRMDETCASLPNCENGWNCPDQTAFC